MDDDIFGQYTAEDRKKIVKVIANIVISSASALDLEHLSSVHIVGFVQFLLQGISRTIVADDNAIKGISGCRKRDAFTCSSTTYI